MMFLYISMVRSSYIIIVSSMGDDVPILGALVTLLKAMGYCHFWWCCYTSVRSDHHISSLWRVNELMCQFLGLLSHISKLLDPVDLDDFSLPKYRQCHRYVRCWRKQLKIDAKSQEWVRGNCYHFDHICKMMCGIWSIWSYGHLVIWSIWSSGQYGHLVI